MPQSSTTGSENRVLRQSRTIWKSSLLGRRLYELMEMTMMSMLLQLRLHSIIDCTVRCHLQN